MSASSRVRVYLGCSLDGFIAGPNDDLSFLHDAVPEMAEAPEPSKALSFEGFMDQVGAMLMGRRSHDVIAGMGVWAYGDTQVLVATHRDLEPAADSVRAVSGSIESLIPYGPQRPGWSSNTAAGGSTSPPFPAS